MLWSAIAGRELRAPRRRWEAPPNSRVPRRIGSLVAAWLWSARAQEHIPKPPRGALLQTPGARAPCVDAADRPLLLRLAVSRGLLGIENRRAALGDRVRCGWAEAPGGILGVRFPVDLTGGSRAFVIVARRADRRLRPRRGSSPGAAAASGSSATRCPSSRRSRFDRRRSLLVGIAVDPLALAFDAIVARRSTVISASCPSEARGASASARRRMFLAMRALGVTRGPARARSRQRDPRPRRRRAARATCCCSRGHGCFAPASATAVRWKPDRRGSDAVIEGARRHAPPPEALRSAADHSRARTASEEPPEAIRLRSATAISTTRAIATRDARGGRHRLNPDHWRLAWILTTPSTAAREGALSAP
jgi:hypothetical protein